MYFQKKAGLNINEIAVCNVKGFQDFQNSLSKQNIYILLIK